jgi:hypothetical protein
MHKGNQVILLGYVQTQKELRQFINPLQYLEDLSR